MRSSPNPLATDDIRPNQDMKTNLRLRSGFSALLLLTAGIAACASPTNEPPAEEHGTAEARARARVRFGTERVTGLDVFFREAGRPGDPKLVLLHGFPTSSHMYHGLLEELGNDYHVIAPDYPGFGESSAPLRTEFAYTFDGLARIVDGFLEQRGFDRYSLYIQDFGAPVGFRIATAHPERVEAIIVQNGNAYAEGIGEDAWAGLRQYWA
ncbi:MAG: alpha/beta fold hydrolase, partial [Planctomycetota bacterium]